jgi:hypothetical protein
MTKYLKVTFIKILSALVNLGTLVILGILSKDNVIIYASTLAIITMCVAIWDAGAATLNSNIDLETNTAYRLAAAKILNQALKITAIVVAILFAFKQNGANQQFTAAVCIVGLIPTTYLLRWGIIKRRSGYVLDSIIFSETIPAITRFALIPMFIYDPMSSFLIYYLLMVVYTIKINKTKQINNLGLFFISKNGVNEVDEISMLFFSIITALKDQFLSLMSPFMSATVGATMIFQQRIVAVLQIMLSGVHSLLPIELREKNFRRIWAVLIYTLFVCGFLTFSSNYIIEVLSLIFLDNAAIKLNYISWMILWSPIFLSLVITLMIARGKAIAPSLIEILQIIAFIALIRNF